MFCDIPHNWYKLQHRGFSPRDALWSLVSNGQTVKANTHNQVVSSPPHEMGSPAYGNYYKRNDLGRYSPGWGYSVGRGSNNTQLLYKGLTDQNVCCSNRRGIDTTQYRNPQGPRMDCTQELEVVLCQVCKQTCNKAEANTQCLDYSPRKVNIGCSPCPNYPTDCRQVESNPSYTRNDCFSGYRKSKFLTVLLKRKRLNHQTCNDLQQSNAKCCEETAIKEKVCKPCRCSNPNYFQKDCSTLKLCLVCCDKSSKKIRSCHCEDKKLLNSQKKPSKYICRCCNNRKPSKEDCIEESIQYKECIVCCKESSEETSYSCKDVNKVTINNERGIRECLCCNTNKTSNECSEESVELVQCVACCKNRAKSTTRCCCKDNIKPRKDNCCQCCKCKDRKRTSKICCCKLEECSEFKKCNCTAESEDSSCLQEVGRKTSVESCNCREYVHKTVSKLVQVFDKKWKSCREVAARAKAESSKDATKSSSDDDKKSELLIGKFKQVGDCCVVILKKSLSQLQDKPNDTKIDFAEFKSCCTQMSSMSIDGIEKDHKPTQTDCPEDCKLLETWADVCCKLVKETLLLSAEATKGTCKCDCKEEPEESEAQNKKKPKKRNSLFKKWN